MLVLDLPGTLVGYASDGVVYLDIDAAGHGWGPGGYDLATVLTHELGHLLGLDHDQLAGALRSTSPAAVTATRPATPVTMAAARPLGPANTLPSTGVRTADSPDAVGRDLGFDPLPLPAVGPLTSVPDLGSTRIRVPSTSTTVLSNPISVSAVRSAAPPARDTAYLLWLVVALLALAVAGRQRVATAVTRTTPA